MRPSVLIVDDEKVICKGLSRVLANDYDTYYALNGHEALEILGRKPYMDVMLCDIKMPEMEGTDLIEHIRSTNKDIIIIVITAVTDPRKVCDAMKKGADAFLLKPLNIPRLESMIRNMTHQRKAFPHRVCCS